MRPPPPSKPATLHARALKVDIFDSNVLVELAAGREAGFDKDATFASPKFPDAEVRPIRVDKTTTLVKTTMTREQVEANPIFDITPAPPPPPEPNDDGPLNP